MITSDNIHETANEKPATPTWFMPALISTRSSRAINIDGESYLGKQVFEKGSLLVPHG